MASSCVSTVAKVPSAGSYDTAAGLQLGANRVQAGSGLADTAVTAAAIEAKSVGRASLLKNDSEREGGEIFVYA